MSAAAPKSVESVESVEQSLEPSCRDTAAHALSVVRDGVITGEGPTTKGRVHFSRSLDADDTAGCTRILTATAVDDLLAKAVAHYAASASGLKVPPRNVALAQDIESWAPSYASKVNSEMLEW